MNRELLAKQLGVYLVMGIEPVNGIPAIELARQAIAGGVGVIGLL